MIPTNLGMNLDEATYKRNEKNNFISRQHIRYSKSGCTA